MFIRQNGKIYKEVNPTELSKEDLIELLQIPQDVSIQQLQLPIETPLVDEPKMNETITSKDGTQVISSKQMSVNEFMHMQQ